MERLDLSKEWIPVNDGLPTEKGLYMVSIDPRYLPPSDVSLVDIWGMGRQELAC